MSRFFCLALAVLGPVIAAEASDSSAATHYRETIEPLLKASCWDCHSEGTAEGGVAFDEHAEAELLANRRLWWRVLRNVRAEIMPPHDAGGLSDADRREIVDWVIRDIIEVDPQQPDPGRVTLRRLNRIEYRNTIRDLMGVDFDSQAEFPPDDSGHGFDNIAEVLSISPLLMEKYLEAARTIVEQAVPTQSRVVGRQEVPGKSISSDDQQQHADRLTFYKPAKVGTALPVKEPGEYRVILEARINGDFDFDPGRCRVEWRVDGEPIAEWQLAWQDGKPLIHSHTVTWEPGEHHVELQLEPLVAESERKNQLDLTVQRVVLEGPLAESSWREPPRYREFFPRGAPVESAERLTEARRLLAEFGTRAIRRPLPDSLLDRLVAAAQAVYEQPDQSFEAGITEAMVALLSSPQFLFRVERPLAEDVARGDRYPRIDEYSLASRLSYFFWSTMPDAELLALADSNQLRAQLPQQVTRLLADERARQFVRHFTGQWLQARDVEGISIDPLGALGVRDDYLRLEAEFQKQSQHPWWAEPKAGEPEALGALRQEIKQLLMPARIFTDTLRAAMREESEQLFDYIVRGDRSLLEFIDSDYVFVNEELAKFYGLDPVEGKELRRVQLPPDHPRGGVLTQGTFLIVTSNPTRTSPVKRGLFVLDNILGTPAPPAPGGVPDLEKADVKVTGREPTLREMLEVHRAQPICASCHERFDPLGLALEQFNAMGQYRSEEQGLPIDASGSLITGESFQGIRDLKQILVTSRRLDYYRCLVEKFLMYSLGRGLEDVDEWTVEQIVGELERSGGRASVLLEQVVNSAPFQRMRWQPIDSPQAQAVTLDR